MYAFLVAYVLVGVLRVVFLILGFITRIRFESTHFFKLGLCFRCFDFCVEMGSLVSVPSENSLCSILADWFVQAFMLLHHKNSTQKDLS